MTTPITTTTQPGTAPTSQTVPPQNTTLQGAQTFSQDELNAATEKGRKEAHDRLYGRIDELNKDFKVAQEQLAELQAERETAAEAKVREEQEAAAAQKAKDEEGLELRELIAKRDAEWAERDAAYQARFAQQNEELARRDVMLAKEREIADLDRYRITKLAELAEPDPANGYFGIAPNLVNIMEARGAWGTTKDEIDNTIALIQNETRAILEGMQSAEVAQRAAAPGVAPTAGNVGSPEAMASTRNYSAEDIAAMPINSPEYQALRQQYGMARPQNAGIFG
jgi:hypothetical protein